MSTTSKRSGAANVLIVEKANEAIAELPGAKLTLRQIFYRLVSWLVILNTISAYKGLSRALVKARLDGRVNYDDMEDHTRETRTIFQDHDEITDKVDDVMDTINYAHPVIPRALYQPILHIIALEKEALTSFFDSVIPRGSNVILLTNRGFNSLTQLHEQACKISELKGFQEIYLSYFGDFDPSGEAIETSAIKRLNQQLQVFNVDPIPPDHIERVCLTQAQVVAMNLPGMPISDKKDSRNKGFEAKYGSGVEAVEMNAIPPPVLAQMITDQVAKYWDEDVYQQVTHLAKAVTRRFRKLMLKRLTNEFANP
jgi:hypothetical protein